MISTHASSGRLAGDTRRTRSPGTRGRPREVTARWYHGVVTAGPAARKDDQTGGSAAFALALDPAACIDGDWLVVGDDRVRLDQTPRDDIRRLLGVRRSRAKAITEDDIRSIALALSEAVES